MRKGTFFLSAVLTTFMLALMVGAASAYQKVVKNTVNAVKPAGSPAVQTVSDPLSAPQAAPFSADQAAALAAQVMGRSDLYSVETTDLNGASVYLVTFSSGDLVYVSPEGQIVSISKIVPAVVSAPFASEQRRSHDDGNSLTQSGDDHGSEYEDDHHEEEAH
jgi:hypothetical protein